MKTVIVYLISITNTTDTIGQTIESEVKSKHYGSENSVTSDEWFAANKQSINSKYRVSIHDFEYNGETVAEIDGVRYGIYRTFLNNKNGMIELYLEEKVGVTDNGEEEEN